MQAIPSPLALRGQLATTIRDVTGFTEAFVRRLRRCIEALTQEAGSQAQHVRQSRQQMAAGLSVR